MPKPRLIRLEDYAPPSFLIDQIDLNVDLKENHCDVRSRMLVSRNPKNPAKNLKLDGVELELVEIKLNGKIVKHYLLEEDSLLIFDAPDDFVLDIHTRIYPASNTALMGLYSSSGNFYTQCEAEGFRKITYYLDRPDVLARFTTTIIADKERYPVLLSNGNLVGGGLSGKKRHFAKWVDPFRKPSYLFALVAGKLEKTEDFFLTANGRKVSLQIYTEKGQAKKCAHAMESLKNAMLWDEKRFGLSYDLDHYMIVAVSDFNMGAMENKGLNLFNSKYVLATNETATDSDFEAIESVIGHEYFHNWTGNRVTCRDWFQLSLKEGLTVFRDQEFSADMNSKPLKRVKDVRSLRSAQFPEDSGPTAHPVRPESYMEISNFYTSTIYSKGAEVVRMIHTLLGEDGFKKGLDEYFRQFDGQAVTCDDFLHAMEKANSRDFSQFRLWYSQAGTPKIGIRSRYDEEAKTYTLSVSQSCPATPGQETKAPLLIPLAMGLLDRNGTEIPLQLKGEKGSARTGRVLEITEKEQSFCFIHVENPPTPSLLRNFSAPVDLDFDYSTEELAFLMMHDKDPFNRWEAGQRLYLEILLGLIKKPGNPHEKVIEAFARVLKDDSLDPAFLSQMLTLPSEGEIAEKCDPVDPEAIHVSRQFLREKISARLKRELLDRYELPAKNSGDRAMQNLCLSYLMENPDQSMIDRCFRQFEESGNMTQTLAALSALSHIDCDERKKALERFHEKWQEDALVLDKWFTIQACSRLPGTLESVHKLTHHPKFEAKNPNKVRALIGAFSHSNLYRFHTDKGYRFLAKWIVSTDRLNPQVAARLVLPFSKWRKYDPVRGSLMHNHLASILETEGLSKDVYEIASKSLG